MSTDTRRTSQRGFPSLFVGGHGHVLTIRRTDLSSLVEDLVYSHNRGAESVGGLPSGSKSGGFSPLATGTGIKDRGPL